jgi:hypothetical protein
MATANVTPTKHTPARQLVSADSAERQETALTHAREALRLTEELLASLEVRGEHRLQLEEALAYLEQAVDFLGPVEEFVEPKAQS